MFTGIVEGLGNVTAITDHGGLRSQCVRLPASAATNLQVGASVAHNGCCLTITAINGDEATFDLMGETLAKTNLGALKVGDAVNIERAARFGDEIGGHVMSGHVMDTTVITRIEADEHRHTVWLRLPENLKPYILSKGFVGLDGCSLTVGDIGTTEFCVHLIPETLKRTLFGQRRRGDAINVEIDAQIQAIVDTVTRFMVQRGKV